jgi:hypothetical protein
MKLGVRSRNYPLWLLASGLGLLIASWVNYPALPHNLTSNSSLHAQREAEDGERSFCSEQDIKTLVPQLLRDLPGYANRVSQRARRLARKNEAYTYVIVAGNPEFEPLPLNPAANTPEASVNPEGVEQVFFTTLERQYMDGKIIQIQEFHRLFLTKTNSGWRLVMMFSQIGSYPKLKPPTPPRDSSNGIIAQGIQNWLRDCRNGSVGIRSGNLGV